MNIRLFSLGLLVVCVVVSMRSDYAYAEISMQKFLENASIGNQFEISSSRMALQKSHSKSIKQFAQQMIDDHIQIGSQMESVLTAEGIATPASDLDSKHQKLLDKFNTLSGKDFDKKYIKNQFDAHKDAVKLFQDYAEKGDNDSLKQFAAQTLPTLEEHMEHVEQLKKQRNI